MITNALPSLFHRRWDGDEIALIEEPESTCPASGGWLLAVFAGITVVIVRAGFGRCVRQPITAKVAIEHIWCAQMIRASKAACPSHRH